MAANSDTDNRIPRILLLLGLIVLFIISMNVNIHVGGLGHIFEHVPWVVVGLIVFLMMRRGGCCGKRRTTDDS